MSSGPDILNWPAFILGCAALLACLLAQGTTVVTVMTVFKSRIRASVSGGNVVLAHVYFLSAITSLLLSHILQIYIWSVALYMPGIMPNIHHAILFTGSTYTTVGFANDTLPQQWQLLAVIMAMTGLFAFAWSTSIMYALSQQVYRAED